MDKQFWNDLLLKNMQMQHGKRPSLFSEFVPQSKTGQFRELTNTDQSKIWFWSDLHFWHNNIIKYSNRPYVSVDEMNNQLVNAHNSVISADDVVIWVGDVAFKNTADTNALLARLVPAYRILIVGNHDIEHKKSEFKRLDFDETHSNYVLDNAWCTHYPMNRIPKGVYNIHGHLHTNVTDNPRNYNVSVEVQDYKPKRYTTIIEDMVTVSLDQDENDATYDNLSDATRHGNSY